MLDDRLHCHADPNAVISFFIMESKSNVDFILIIPAIGTDKLIFHIKNSLYCIHHSFLNIETTFAQGIITTII